MKTTTEFFLNLKMGSHKAIYKAEYQFEIMMGRTEQDAHAAAEKKIRDTVKMMKNLKFKY